jgi:hypothetical protein
VVRLENNMFDVGTLSNPAKFSKLLKNIKNHIQKTCKSPNNMFKTIQQLERVTLSYPSKPKKGDKQCLNKDRNPDTEAFEMAVFVWKEDYKSMKSRMEKYKDNKSNAWALMFDQCSLEMKNKLEGTEGYNSAMGTNNIANPLTLIREYCCQFDLLSDEYIAIMALMIFYFCQIKQSIKCRLTERLTGNAGSH